MSDRHELRESVVRLRNQGMKYLDIADALGISRSYASLLINDPDGSLTRSRKDSYRGICVDCGTRTDGSNGRSGQAKRCAKCAAAHNHETRGWTPERILPAFQRYHDENGVQPAAQEILHMRPGLWFPSVGTVQREFGSWSEAIRRMGWVPNHKRNGKGNGMSEYVILRQNGDGGFHPVSRASGTSRDHALRNALAEIPEDERTGTYATVPTSQWMPRNVSLRMRPVLEINQ